jgi:hypothetical protein
LYPEVPWLCISVKKLKYKEMSQNIDICKRT